MSSQGKDNTAESQTDAVDSIIADAMMDENVIADYLQTHPEFFQRHSELLQTLQVPHQAGTSSLIERQVAVLRDKVVTLKSNLMA